MTQGFGVDCYSQLGESTETWIGHNITGTNIAFNWGTVSYPSFCLFSSLDNFGLRFVALVRASVSGDYQFCVSAAGRVRLYVNGATAIDDWNIVTTTRCMASSVTSWKGQLIHVILEYGKTTGEGYVSLLWTVTNSDSPISQSVVPASQVFRLPGFSLCSFAFVSSYCPPSLLSLTPLTFPSRQIWFEERLKSITIMAAILICM